MEIILNKIFDVLIDKIIKTDSNFQSILKLSSKLESGNFYLAGGSVRDSILDKNKKLKDVDLFISQKCFSDIENIVRNTGKYILNPFGSLRWYPNEAQEFYYDIIIIEKFYNGLWKCENIIDVLNQFDITANAVAFDLKTKTFYNPNNGLLHIKRKELRAIRFDYPEINISEEISLSRNTVLWFRYNYYAKKLGFSVDELTQKWIDENRIRETEKQLFTQHFFNPDN